MTYILYFYCECYVWPIDMTERYGRCGRCGTRPYSEGFRDKQEALEAFREEHGHYPEPIYSR